MSTYAPIREIHEVELSSVCNLACVYCPHPAMTREKAHASFDVIEGTLRHLRYLCDQGTQGEVSLTGIGEAILHPNFSDIVHAIRCVIGPRKMILSTNGLALTDEHIKTLRDYGVGVYVSLHRMEVATHAYERLKAAGVSVGINHGFVDNSMDWAGQVKWHTSQARYLCRYLDDAWGVVRQDGSVVTCCMDAMTVDPIGHVSDAPGTLRTRLNKLCSQCNLVPPAKLAA